MSRRRAERAPRKPLHEPIPAQAAEIALQVPGGVPGVIAVCVLLLAGFGGGMIYDQTPLSPITPSLFSLVAVPACLALVALGLIVRAARSATDEAARGAARIGGYAFLAFAGLSACSVLCAKYRWSSEVGAMLVIGVVGLGCLVRSVARDETGYRLVLWAHVGAAALVAALGLNEYLTNVRSGNPAWRVFGGFVNPDFLAGYLILAVPVALGLFLTSRERHLTLAAGVAFVLQLLCLLFTQSRLGLMAVAVSLVVLGVSAAAASRAGVLDASTRKRVLALGVLGLLIVLAGARPVLHRLRTASAESYSAQFRALTWKGTLRMGAAHPVLGTGIATFETAYPPYAQVGFTRHGHSSVLQLLGETGALGLGALLLGVGAACFGATRARRPSMRLLDGAVVAGIAGSLAHSLTDSDLHIPAIAFGFATLCGLALAAGSTPRGEGGQTQANPLLPLAKWAPVVPALLLLWFSAKATYARTQALAAEEAIDAGNGAAALPAYQSAVGATPGDVEFRLRLASIYQGSRQLDDAARAYRDAIEAAPTGKAFYRYARFLSAKGDVAGAVSYFERARAAEPNNMQNLLALAEAYRSAERPADADRVYDHLIALADQDMGRVRPLPELVDWEFGEAFAARADSYLRAGDATHAEPLLKRAAGILGEFWRSRNRSEAEMRVSPEVRARTKERYGTVLGQWIDCLKRLGRQSEIAAIEQQQRQFAQDQEADAKKQ